MLRFASLGSGSKGNATLVESGKTRILIDCGFALGEVEKRLWRLQCEPESITAILVSHEHSDHAAGVGRLARRYRIPVYASMGTFNSMKDAELPRFTALNIHQPFSIQNLLINPFPVPHDAREPCQFVLSEGTVRLGILTDVGSFTPYIVEQLQGLQGLMLECNYDSNMLHTGPYPISLKRRVAGTHGHLDNAQATQLLYRLDQSKFQHVVGMHLSEQNNLPQHAQAALAAGLNCSLEDVQLADQSSGFDWRELKN